MAGSIGIEAITVVKGSDDSNLAMINQIATNSGSIGYDSTTGLFSSTSTTTVSVTSAAAPLIVANTTNNNAVGATLKITTEDAQIKKQVNQA